jgi:hypothetical protein
MIYIDFSIAFYTRVDLVFYLNNNKMVSVLRFLTIALKAAMILGDYFRIIKVRKIIIIGVIRK